MKRKRKKRRLPFRRRPKISPELLRDLEKSKKLLERERFEEVIDLLEPYAEQGVQEPRLHADLGIAYAHVGDLHQAIEHLQKAVKDQESPYLWAILGSMYAMTGNHTLATEAYHQAEKLGISLPPAIASDIAQWEEDIHTVARQHGIAFKQAQAGLKALERGRIALAQGDFAVAKRHNKESLNLFGSRYIPALNNLSLAHFFLGEWPEAIASARQALEMDPDNVQALGNLVRFLAWSGQEEAAREVWDRLKQRTPANDDERLKMVEAAAIMNDDAAVYALLNDVIDEMDMLTPQAWERNVFYLAVAAANLGKTKEARGWFRELARSIPLAQEYLDLLKEGKRGPGLMDRFPYFLPNEILSYSAMEELLQLVDEESSMPPDVFRERIEAFTQRYPQTELALGQFLWESEGRPESIELLAMLNTPKAQEILKTFALGDKGKDELRMLALNRLVEMGAIPTDTPMPFWIAHEGRWESVSIRQTKIIPIREKDYDPRVAELLEQGRLASAEGRWRDAEAAFRQALELDPTLPEVYNNLAAALTRLGQSEEARALLEKALEIDPDYLLARCNLAWSYLDRGLVDEAQALVESLGLRSDYHPQEFAAWALVQAEIYMRRGDYVRAKNLLETSLQVYPDYEPAQRKLEALETMDTLGLGMESLSELQKIVKKDARRYRLRQQRKLTNPNPSLREALSIYTKDQLKAMTWHIAPEGGFSALRKAELLDFLAERLQNEAALQRMLLFLSPLEHKALQTTLAQGGVMDWEAFKEAFGHDLEESPHWQYHEPDTPMGRLRVRGLIMEAMDGDRLVITIPLELRELLKRLLRK